MRRLRTGKASIVGTRDNERGASAVIVAFFLVVLLGVAALAIDVGAAYAERAQLQTGADATALAIATDCARGVNCPTAMSDARNLLDDDNANDGSSGIFSVTQPTANSVRVETNAQEPGSTADSFSLFFARAMGVDATIIHAAAVASWGPPASGSTLPWTVSECVFRQSLTPAQRNQLDTTGTFTGDPLETHILLRYDERTPAYPGCEAENGLRPGGFGWLEPNADCSADIDSDSTVDGRPGNSYPTVRGDPSVCQDVLAGILDQPVLIPLFSTATDAGGTRTRYNLIGFAAFEVTGYRFGGGPGLNVVDSEAPACTGSCRGLMGFFTRFVTLDEGGIDTGGGDDFGANRVALTD